MATQNLGSLRSSDSDGDLVSLELRRLETARRSVQDKIVDASDILAQTERDQLARDFADIERAAAALRRAEPTLQAGTESTATAVRKPSPVWLLIAGLWLSTALVAAGAVAAIAKLAG